jgi:hypothetical protein
MVVVDVKLHSQLNYLIDVFTARIDKQSDGVFGVTRLDFQVGLFLLELCSLGGLESI